MQISPGITTWIQARLYRKFLAGSASGLVLMSMLFYLIFIGMYRAQLEEERSKASVQMNQLLQATLENAMLKRDLDGLRGIIKRLGQQREIANTMILNPRGEVRFASTENLLGQFFPAEGAQKNGSTLFTMNPNKREVLRSVNPVYNKQPCVICHGPIADNPINGVLVVDYDASIIRTQARNTTLWLMVAGSTIVLITLVGSWWFMQNQIGKPINTLIKAHSRFSRDELAARIDSPGNDEIGQLGLAFNQMARTIQTSLGEIKQKETFLQSLIDGIPDGVRVIDRNYKVVAVNNAYLEQTGMKQCEAVGEACYASVHARKEPCTPTLLTCPLHEIKENGQPIKVLHRHHKKTGGKIEVEIFAAPIMVDSGNSTTTGHIIEVIRNLAEIVQFSQEQRLSTLGELAAGVAHEIHNPLGSIQIAFSSIFHATRKENFDPTEVQKYLKLVEGEIEKCIEVTGRLLKLSTLPGSSKQLVMLDQVINETVSLLKWEGEAKMVNTEVSLNLDNPRVIATDSEMRIVVLNLVQNAFHAMPNGGELQITLTGSNQNIVIGFTDTGVGISEQNLLRIFDPFFSARADHKQGTGLGLAITRAIIERADGTIDAASVAGECTTFTITLPDADSGNRNS